MIDAARATVRTTDLNFAGRNVYHMESFLLGLWTRSATSLARKGVFVYQRAQWVRALFFLPICFGIRYKYAVPKDTEVAMYPSFTLIS